MIEGRNVPLSILLCGLSDPPQCALCQFCSFLFSSELCALCVSALGSLLSGFFFSLSICKL